MVFSSMIFLWLFLPFTVIGYRICGKKYQNIFLLLVSLFFYAWGEPVYILLMMFSILINWLYGMAFDRAKHKRLLLIVNLLINLGLLVYFKYFNLLIETIMQLTGKEILHYREIPLPIGISFFTFQAISYVIDLYRGKYKPQKNLINLALYISFFPQLIAGPIVKYVDINEQLTNRVVTAEKTAEGIRRFLYGLGKKVIFSNTLAECADKIYGLELNNLTGVYAWIGALCYTLQIYYDFSGYSDMAIGLGKMFGFEFLENFNYPYLSKSVTEFWRRWHISLGTWFREYLYIPLGGNRKGIRRTYINLFIVFAVTGFWHGAEWNFLLWGVYHGILIIVERIGFKKLLDKHTLLGWLYTLLAVVGGWVLFRVTDVSKALACIKRMILPWRYRISDYSIWEIIDKKTLILFILAAAGSGLIPYILKKSKLDQKLKDSYAEIIYCFLIAVLSLMMLAGNAYNPFIYFRF
ncbi:MAG: MBOAT family protein [Lachnospiraceae bacterium]|nr:MBOAT family protein [Lachnospiraceae bacterium]